MSQIAIFSSEQIPAPQLRFDYALRVQTSSSAFEGFRRWGPYDKNQPRKLNITCAVVYPSHARNEARRVKEAFLNGMFFFRGFYAFSRGIKISHFDEFALNVNPDDSLATQAQIYRSGLEEILQKANWDFVFCIIPYSQRYLLESPYYASKLILSASGIPCQLLSVEKVRSDETFKWSLANIALQVYAKLGNIPWVVEAPDHPSDLIVGIGKRELRDGRFGAVRRFMGFTTAYHNNGAFLSFTGITSNDTSQTYEDQLSIAISNAIIAYKNSRAKHDASADNPQRIIFHSFKKVGHREIEAIEEGIRKACIGNVPIPYALLRIDDSASFMVFDDDHKTYLPQSGFSITLGPLQRLLLTEGRERYDHRRVGFTTPYVVHLDARSKLGEDDFVSITTRLVEQVFRLSKVNWRGFNAASTPITLGYSRLIAEVVASCSPEVWSQISAEGNLRDKAWFL